MIIVVVTDDHDIHERQLFNLAGRWGISFESSKLDWRAAVFEYGVEEDT